MRYNSTPEQLNTAGFPVPISHPGAIARRFGRAASAACLGFAGGDKPAAGFALSGWRRLAAGVVNPGLRIGLLLASACLGLAATGNDSPSHSCAPDSASCAAPAAASSTEPADDAAAAQRKAVPTSALSARESATHEGTGIHKEPPISMPFASRPEPSERTAERQPKSSAYQSANCDVNGFATKSGDALTNHIRSVTYECINALFYRASQSIRTAAFRTQNMLDVAQATVEIMATYQGENTPDNLFSKHYAFLRAAYYNLSRYRDHVEWATRTRRTAVDNAVIDATDAFFQNDHFYDLTDSHSETAWEVFVLTSESFEKSFAAHLPKLKDWLNRFGSDHVEKVDVIEATSVIYDFLSDLHEEQELVSIVSSDIELMTVLQDFALRDYMLGTPAQGLVESAGQALAQFLQYDTAPIHPSAVSGIQAILGRYDRDGEGSAVWIATASVVLYLDKCAEFQICDFKPVLEGLVLSVKHSCAQIDANIRSQSLTPEQLAKACASMTQVNGRFHTLLNTGRQPMANDYNTSLEVIVFEDRDSYVMHSKLFFGNRTDNGGIYLEGSPDESGNVARFIAYVATWLPGRPIWNLEHEYVHYLDGRFNIYGGFLRGSKSVWWQEGLAEYVSKGNSNARAASLAPGFDYFLDDLFSTTYRHNENRVYAWSYLAVRFMFERHADNVSGLVGYLRGGCFNEYRNYVERTIGTSYNNEWREWLKTVEATDNFVADRGVESIPVACGPGVISYLDLDSPLPPVELFPLEETTTIDIARFFDGFSTARLTFTATSSNPQVAVASLDGRLLTLTALASGQSVIAITANDGSKSITRTFQLAVTKECPPWLCRSWSGSWRWQILMDSGPIR